MQSRMNGSWFELVHARRKDGSVTYTVESTTNLLSNVWKTNHITVPGIGNIDADYEAVTNRIDTTEGQGFLRLLVE